MNTVDFNDLLDIRKGIDGLTMGAGVSEVLPVSSVEEWEQKAFALRELYEMTLGQPPYEPVEPCVEILSEENCSGYIRRKIAYDTGPCERINAYVLMPEQLFQKCPAVICLHQTTPLGKEQVIGNDHAPDGHNFAYALHLAKRGFVTFAFDLLSSGERCYPNCRHFETTPFYELFPKWSVRGKDLYDVSRAIDVLQQMPEVNRNKIGCIGHSQGGGITIHAMAVESRINVGVSSCGIWPMRISKNPFNEARSGWWVGRPMLRPFCLTGKEFPVQVHELMALAAPRPLMNISAMNDFNYSLDEKYFTLQAFQNMADNIKKVYTFYNKKDSFISMTHLNGHSFIAEQQIPAYAFLEKYLFGE
jgi:hypothetical protein